MFQPHLPVRLPCYNLAPIISPIFNDSSYGHHLQILPTFIAWWAVCTRSENVFTATRWFAITSDSSFMRSNCRPQSELGRVLSITHLLPDIDCTRHCSTCVALGIKAVMTWPHLLLPLTYVSSLFKVPTITCWQLNMKVALVMGLNHTPHGTSWRRPCSTLHFVPKEDHISVTVKGILAQVRFPAYWRIKPHAPPLVRTPVNSFEFHSCERTTQVDHLSLSLRLTCFYYSCL